MIRNHTTKNARPYQNMVAPVQGDAVSEIRNGYPASVYLPRDPGRRQRLLQLLGLRNTNGEEIVTEDTTDYMLEGNDA